jgi:DNA-binding transcriptional MocR family regulator
MARAKWWNRLRRAKGQHGGPLRSTGIEVLEALLYSFQNRKTGDCFPSLAKIAERIGRAESVVAKAVQRLAAAKLLFIVPRRDRGIRRDGRKLPVVTSNAYVFPPTTEISRGTAVRANENHPLNKQKAASAWSADLRSPAATASSPIPLPAEVEPPF